MNWLLALVASVVVVEIFIRLRVLERIAEVNRSYARSLRAVRRKASDHWKEKAMLGCSARTMKASALLLLSLIAISLPLLLLGMVSFDDGPTFMEFLISLPGLIGLTAMATAYAFLRSRLVR